MLFLILYLFVICKKNDIRTKVLQGIEILERIWYYRKEQMFDKGGGEYEVQKNDYGNPE